MTHLVYVQSRGWLLGKLGAAVLLMAGAVLVWGPLVAGRPHAVYVAGWLAWAAIALVVVGALVRVAEAVWGTGCIAYVIARSAVTTFGSIAAVIGRTARRVGQSWRRVVAVFAVAIILAPSTADA